MNHPELVSSAESQAPHLLNQKLGAGAAVGFNKSCGHPDAGARVRTTGLMESLTLPPSPKGGWSLRTQSPGSRDESGPPLKGNRTDQSRPTSCCSELGVWPGVLVIPRSSGLSADLPPGNIHLCRDFPGPETGPMGHQGHPLLAPHPPYWPGNFK